MGRTQNLKLEFLVPQKQIAAPLTEKTIDTQEKYIIAGNAEGIAINTDKIVLPELRPQEDTQTSEFLPTQKLYRTALNYLDRLQRNHDELSEIIGAKFTNTATRAIVFNGIAVSYQNNEPYSFNWTGLRIDASALVSYYHRFNQDINKQQKEFMFLFGLEGSLDESSIFEEDFQIEAMSTVKGLRLINQGQIAGVQTKKITMANISDIDSLQISDNLKTKYRDSVRQGNTIYTPTKQYTYQNWTGLVYISVNPNTGFGGYIIGEGLNGGYTVAQWLANWLYFWKTGLITNAQAIINLPKTVYTLGEKLIYSIFYKFFLSNGQVVEIEEPAEKDTKDLGVGSQPIKPNYQVPGETKTTEVKYGKRLGTQDTNKYDELIFKHAEQYKIPPPLLKSLIYKESGSKFNPDSYRYEPCWDYNKFSGPAPSIGLSQHPYEHFRLAGYDAQGSPITQGDQISTLSPAPLAMASSKTDYGLKIIDTDKNGTLTLEELWAQNDSVQHWSWFCTTISNKNFTAQVLLAATYGLTQMGYPTAVDYGFDSKTEQGNPARNVYELFKEDANIKLGAWRLIQRGDKVPTVNTCTNNDDWWGNLRDYNGSGPKAEKYATEVCGYYNSGLFNEQE